MFPKQSSYTNDDNFSALPNSPRAVSDRISTYPTYSSETIGVTGNHQFWSVDRAEFVQAGELVIGERLQTLGGDIRWVQQKLPRPGPEPVYNLEVHGEHVYYVGDSGVLAHNAGDAYGNVWGIRYRNNKSPALRDSPYHPDEVANRIKPPYRVNPAHDARSGRFNKRKTPEPDDANEVYERSVRGGMGTWYGVGKNGDVYRFFSDNAGGVHFSGIVSVNSLPKEIRGLLGL